VQSAPKQSRTDARRDTDRMVAGLAAERSANRTAAADMHPGPTNPSSVGPQSD